MIQSKALGRIAEINFEGVSWQNKTKMRKYIYLHMNTLKINNVRRLLMMENGCILSLVRVFHFRAT